MPLLPNFVATQAQNLFQGPDVDGIRGGRQPAYWSPPPNLEGVDPSLRIAVMKGVSGEGVDIGDGSGSTQVYCAGWDTIYLAGNQLPGLISVKCEQQLQIDQQKGPKHDGAVLILHGYLPGPIEISVTLWTLDQWAAWNRLVPTFWRRPEKSSDDLAKIAADRKISPTAARLLQAAVDVSYPGLLMLGITQLIVRGISVPEPGPAPQTRVIRLRCIEFRPPSKHSPPSKVVKKHATKAPDDARVPPSPSKTSTGAQE